MKYPKRPDQHISETASYKIFNSKIPDRWIIREITERDYGIDCYIELVNIKNELTGELISIQLKSREKIEWNKTEPTKWTLSGVKIETTNYWYGFSVPGFICVVDISTEEVFFQSVNQYIKKNHLEYRKQTIFSYKIDKSQKLENADSIGIFLLQYCKDKNRRDFEKNIITFFANYAHYNDFFQANTGRDSFMGVETGRILYARSFYNNLQFLAKYLDIEWGLKTFNEYEKMSESKYGDTYHLYEEHLDQIVTELHNMLLPILLELKKLIGETEQQYWLNTDIKLFNLVINVSYKGEIKDW